MSTRSHDAIHRFFRRQDRLFETGAVYVLARDYALPLPILPADGGEWTVVPTREKLASALLGKIRVVRSVGAAHHRSRVRRIETVGGGRLRALVECRATRPSGATAFTMQTRVFLRQAPNLLRIDMIETLDLDAQALAALLSGRPISPSAVALH